MPTPRKEPHILVQLNTSIDAVLAGRLYETLRNLEQHGRRMTTRKAVSEAIEHWLARQDMAQLPHISEQEITHAQPE